GYVIPALKVNEAYFLGKGHSIFTAELIAILMALNKIISLHTDFLNILFCVDSKSVLQTLDSNSNKEGCYIIDDIKYLIHSLIINGTNVQFCWIPSHSGLN
uniref:ribonuclease H family protein n=1 Tax=Acinetobacter baumannii TaxID=470 RepID=UPI0033936F46